MKPRGFTLTEVLIVLAIVGVLTAVAFPLTRNLLGKSREAACLNNLRSLGVALESYLQEHNQLMPTMELGRASKTEEVPVMDTILLPYLENKEAFACRADSAQFEKTGSSYAWNHLQNGRHVTKLVFFGITDRPDKIPLITDKESWHPSGTNFLYADQSSSNKARFVADIQ